MSNIVEKLKDMLVDSIIGRKAVAKVFTDRATLEFPDYDFLENVNVRKDEPYMALIIASQAYSSMHRLVEKTAIQTVSEIEHQGSSQASFDLSGSHRGNNYFILEIVTSGALGAAEYHLSKDGGESFGEAQTVPPGGQVAIGDGTTLTFGAEGDLVAGDSYYWQTVSMMELKYRTDELTVRIVIELYTADEIELLGNDNFTGYFDQLKSFFTEQRAIHDGEHIFRINLDRKAQPYSDFRAGKFRGVISVIIEGALYYKKQVPLIGALVEEVVSP